MEIRPQIPFFAWVGWASIVTAIGILAGPWALLALGVLSLLLDAFFQINDAF